MSSATTPSGAPGEAHREVDGRDRPAGQRLLALETILQGSELNVTIFDREYVVRDVSRSAAALLGRSREEMRGRSLLEELPPAHHETLARTLAGESIHEQGKLLPKGGEQES
jgi:PAS domain S-box-containing protein